MTDLTLAEVKDIHEIVKQFLHRHKNEFIVYGDAMDWLRETDHETIRQESGTLGRSLLTTDILWLISRFSPKSEIDFGLLAPDVKKPVPDYVEPELGSKPEVEKPKKQRGRPPGSKSKKSGPTNALREVVIVDKPPVAEETPVINVKADPKPSKRVKRRAGRVPPGAFAENK